MKPEVKYHTAVYPPEVGGRALVHLAGPHHTLNGWYEGRSVTTSEVIWIDGNGNFETLNTKYIKVMPEYGDGGYNG